MEGLLLVMCALFVSYLASFSFTGAMAVDPLLLPKQVLIFGGNGMLGSATVERLIPLEHKLVLVNRGNYYWDTAFTIYPFVQHIQCDRWQKLEDCHDLVVYINDVNAIDLVIDFSAYNAEAIQNSLELLNGKAKLYIYISTDSVYEVCAKNHSLPTTESDAVRPFSVEEQDRLNANDNYGHRKLQCEETLQEYRREGKGPPYIILRLPDVVGPRDNTERWWTYQLWMKLQPVLDIPVAVPSDLATKSLSFVYVNDVADLIFNLFVNPIEAAFDEAFNLAIVETLNLTGVLNDIKEELNLTELSIAVSDDPDTIKFFPSVHLGPVDISKAEQILKWKPTEWLTVVKQTTTFYENAMRDVQFDRVRRGMIRKFQTHFTSKPNDVIHGLIDIYDLNLRRPKDEL